MSSYAQRVRVYGTGYDRRVKLTEDDKEYIRWLWDEEGLSYNKLAAKFGVSKRLIMFVVRKSMPLLEHREKPDGRMVDMPSLRNNVLRLLRSIWSTSVLYWTKVW